MKAIVDHYPKLGPLIYLLSIQYFLIQIYVALQWSPSYSLSSNTISDLGNTVCGAYGGRFVCSPAHSLMNGSFILLGITMICGSLLMNRLLGKKQMTTLGFGAMATAGMGTILVGLFPENSIAALHILGAALPFLLGNVAMVLLGFSLSVPKWLRLYSVLSGGVALVALGCFVSAHYLGLGEGGLERIVAYPQTVWLIVLGTYALITHHDTARGLK